MIFELAEDVEAAARDAEPQDGAAGFNESPPGGTICSGCVRVETIGDDGITAGAQYDSETLTERGKARGVVHQRRLKSIIVLEASGVVEEWIGWRGWVQKWLVAANRAG